MSVGARGLLNFKHFTLFLIGLRDPSPLIRWPTTMAGF